MNLSHKLAKLIVEKNVSVDVIVEILEKYSLLGLLPTIQKKVLRMLAHTSVGDTLTIESPFQLSDSAVQHIKKITGNSEVKHETTINKNILAGFKARYKGILYDGSAERIMKQIVANR